MKRIRVVGIVLFIVGIVAICFASYINSQVAQGKVQVEQGEKKISAGKKLFSATPLTEQFGGIVTSGGEKKIARGKEQISHYESVATSLMTIGIILIIVGAGLFIWSYFDKKRFK